MSEIKEKLQDLEKGLESLGQSPVVVGRDTDTTVKSYDAAEGAALQRELRKRFKQMSTAEVTEMLDIQASRENGKQASTEVLNTLAVANPQIAKLLDASGGAALIRQDLEPLLYALFVKKFPLFERLRKEPANGLVHAYNQQTSFGDATFQTELGTVSDDVNVYARQTTNVAVLATRRGISLKSQFAIQQGGAAGNHGLATELSGGVTAIAKKLQKQILQGNASTSASAGASTELGAFDANGFDGLRKLLGTAAAAGNVISSKGTSSYTAVINETVAGILNNGGNPSGIVLSPTDYAAYTNELLSLVRYPGGGNVDAGIGLGTVATPAGALPLLGIPGDGIGSYAITAGGTTTTFRDIYVIDEDVWSMPFLGNDAITTLEIPVGVAGALTRLYIQFCMYGLANKGAQFNGKIRVTVA